MEALEFRDCHYLLGRKNVTEFASSQQFFIGTENARVFRPKMGPISILKYALEWFGDVSLGNDLSKTVVIERILRYIYFQNDQRFEKNELFVA